VSSTNFDRHDVIVVGSGATGSWAAKELVERGLKVLVLEAGPPGVAPVASAPKSAADVLEIKRRHAHWHERQHTQSHCYACTPQTSHLFVDDVENPYSHSEEHPFYWIRGRQLGGRMWTWAGYAYRMSDWEFKAASRDGVGKDWPISYGDLASYYDRIEQFLRVSGTAESIPNLPDGRFHSSSGLTSGEIELKNAVESRWPERKVIVGRRVSTGAESIMASSASTGRLTIQANAIARQIIADESSGEAAGITYVNRETGEVKEVQSRAVVLCASTIETTRLLLNSTSRNHPKGFANSSGLVGCYLMDHMQVKISGYASASSADCKHDANPNGIYLPQFRNMLTRETRFVRGYGIQGGVSPPADPKTTPGADAFWMAAFGEMLPRMENRVSLNSQMRDAWGIPVPHIECTHGDNEIEMAQDMLVTLREMAAAAGFEITEEGSTLNKPGLCVHEVGTARMGEDRRSSVLNKFNQSWDVRNLFITDGSCFVSQGSQNPTLTMMALTARACEYLATELHNGTL
jgi:choline dehydrogenase-like flavoprotein